MLSRRLNVKQTTIGDYGKESSSVEGGRLVDPTELYLTDPRAYRRLATLIRQQISDRTLQAGQSAPSITSLSQEHGHARQTCGKALRMLESEGLLARIPGLGYYVR